MNILARAMVFVSAAVVIACGYAVWSILHIEPDWLRSTIMPFVGAFTALALFSVVMGLRAWGFATDPNL